jgi:hypothetical protein
MRDCGLVDRVIGPESEYPAWHYSNDEIVKKKKKKKKRLPIVKVSSPIWLGPCC